MAPAILDQLRFVAPYVLSHLVVVVGLLIALVRWRRHPYVSLFATLGFALVLLAGFAGLLAHYDFIFNERFANEQGRFLFEVISFGLLILSLLGHSLVLVALFGWRQAPESASAFQRTPIEDLPHRPWQPDSPNIQPDQPGWRSGQ
jgi:hypothetical protein